MSDLVKRLRDGHDRECAMSYGMHEHCCDCSFPVRQDAAAEIARLWGERDSIMGQAAAEIERLQAERDALRGLLLEAQERMATAENVFDVNTNDAKFGETYAAIDAYFAASGQEPRT